MNGLKLVQWETATTKIDELLTKKNGLKLQATPLEACFARGTCAISLYATNQIVSVRLCNGKGRKSRFCVGFFLLRQTGKVLCYSPSKKKAVGCALRVDKGLGRLLGFFLLIQGSLQVRTSNNWDKVTVLFTAGKRADRICKSRQRHRDTVLSFMCNKQSSCMPYTGVFGKIFWGEIQGRQGPFILKKVLEALKGCTACSLWSLGDLGNISSSALCAMKYLIMFIEHCKILIKVKFNNNLLIILCFCASNPHWLLANCGSDAILIKDAYSSCSTFFMPNPIKGIVIIEYFDMQHAPAKLPSKLHKFEYVDVLAQSLCSLHSTSKLGS
ncbi:hypothetical protein VP01_2672g2 [Puccinia sorghi]|uniref:Uncharacterized protein n=1 Tax=Puccinia sorghi TaxID=27349 RepID=A0A0L6V3V2_9BASI|nr:hypothetical protein VP01_2672g2 [Puccinia sorghi]